jgi:hypothetical protein
LRCGKYKLKAREVNIFISPARHGAPFGAEKLLVKKVCWHIITAPVTTGEYENVTGEQFPASFGIRALKNNSPPG